MRRDKRLYNLYLKEMRATGLQVSKKLDSFVDSFAKRVINEPNTPIEKLYIQEARKFNIVDEIALNIQGGMINQTAIGLGIAPQFAASILGQKSTENLKKIFGNSKGKEFSSNVYESVENSQKEVYKLVTKNAKLNRTWKETSKDLRKTLAGDLKGYENIPNHIKELESVGRQALKSKDKKEFIKAFKKSKQEIANLSDNRALKKKL